MIKLKRSKWKKNEEEEIFTLIEYDKRKLTQEKKKKEKENGKTYVGILIKQKK